MSKEPVEDSRLRQFGLTRSFQDRLFVFLAGILQDAFALFFLSPFFFNRPASNTTSGGLLEIVIAVWFEFLVALLLLGACCIIWGIAAPLWLERLFSKALGHLWVVLMVIGLFLLVAFWYCIVLRV
ncbi:MAG TPA: hypothetical protein VF480_12650 [Verrucomicrobiae bacterium]|jgi:hypothetical protein